LESWAKANPLERIAMKAVAVMDFLLLQRTTPKAKTKDHKRALERRLEDWHAGNISKLFEEVLAIHDHLESKRSKMKLPQLSKTFAGMVFEGKVGAAIRLLSDQASHEKLELTDEVLQELEALHPEGAAPVPESLQRGPFPEINTCPSMTSML
jgi:hypothetical protein